MTPRWQNHEEGKHYSADWVHSKRRLWIFPVSIYRIRMFADCPPTLIDSRGVMWRTYDRKFLSDLGSVPPLLWPFFPPSEFPLAYDLHDNLYQTHKARCSRDASTWQVVSVTRSTADRLLREAVQAKPYRASARKADMIWAGVRVGGWAAW